MIDLILILVLVLGSAAAAMVALAGLLLLPQSLAQARRALLG